VTLGKLAQYLGAPAKKPGEAAEIPKIIETQRSVTQ
jgi:hypothetical protein